MFNSILKQKMNCVAAEEFSEDGKYTVDSLKANLLGLSLVGCGSGDVWDKKDAKSNRANDNLDWIIDFVKNELKMPLLLKGILHPDDAEMAMRKGIFVWP